MRRYALPLLLLTAAFLAGRALKSRAQPGPAPPSATARPLPPRPAPLLDRVDATAVPDRRAERPDPLPRDPVEWQGMLVDRSVQPGCGESSRCGLARACVDSRCVACRSDGECASGEVCVLDHCVLQDRAACRTRRDCGGDSLCVLSGYSPDVRGNATMTARCLDPAGGVPETAEQHAPRPGDPAPPMAVRPDRLLESLD